MPELDDHELLAEFAGTNSEAAFAALVTRHLNLVYSTARRFTGNPHHAEEITQAVFIILARKAEKLSPRVVLSGWLYQVARFTAANFLKGEIRRQHREQEAYMQTILNEPDAMAWKQIAPLLDEAMGKLGETDRNVVVLSFFENKTAAEVATKLKLTEAAAHKRVNRALEKLRKFFTKRGVSSTTAIIAGTISANSVQAAPVALAKSVTAVAIAKGSIAMVSTLTLVKGTMKTMTWLKIKFAIGVGTIGLLAGGVATVAISQTSNSDKLAAQEIIKQSQNAYAALTSYSDEGKEVGSVGTADVAPHTFSIKLTRPNLYQIKWTQDLGFYSQTGAVWSAGSGDFMKMMQASKPAKYPNAERALSAATGISGGASGTVPKSFFNLKSGMVGATMRSATKKPDEKIDGIDCYVLTQSKGGRTETLWIGKQDFLIRQIENDTSAAVLKTMLQDQAKKHPDMHLPTTVGGDVKSVQTHMNIVVNRVIPITDFAP